jgi:hypothetical protein
VSRLSLTQLATLQAFVRTGTLRLSSLPAATAIRDDPRPPPSRAGSRNAWPHAPSVAGTEVGYCRRMTSARSSEELEAIQAVVDRVTSWQDGAPEGTVEDELRHGFSEVGVAVRDDDVRALADAIEEKHGAVHAADVLR